MGIIAMTVTGRGNYFQNKKMPDVRGLPAGVSMAGQLFLLTHTAPVFIL
jgi:hypothetical protein